MNFSSTMQLSRTSHSKHTYSTKMSRLSRAALVVKQFLSQPIWQHFKIKIDAIALASLRGVDSSSVSSSFITHATTKGAPTGARFARTLETENSTTATPGRGLHLAGPQSLAAGYSPVARTDTSIHWMQKPGAFKYAQEQRTELNPSKGVRSLIRLPPQEPTAADRYGSISYRRRSNCLRSRAGRREG
jgi:hypothetical protein